MLILHLLSDELKIIRLKNAKKFFKDLILNIPKRFHLIKLLMMITELYGCNIADTGLTHYPINQYYFVSKRTSFFSKGIRKSENANMSYNY